LIGGRKTYLMEREIAKKKNSKVLTEYCSKISDIQEQSMNYFMAVFLAKLEIEIFEHGKYA
jgi:hypothetical protein